MSLKQRLLSSRTPRVTYLVVYLLALLAALWLIRLVQDVPLEPVILWGLLRTDSLSAFFVLLTLLIAGAKLRAGARHPRALLLITLVLLLVYNTASLFVIATGYLLVVVIGMGSGWAQDRMQPAQGRMQPAQDRTWWGILRHALAMFGSRLETPRSAQYAQIIWALLPCVCLWLAYAALRVQGGTWRYTLPAAGAALSSFVFWFVLLATLLGARVQSLIGRFWPAGARVFVPTLLLTVAWFYPLMRLYSLGPWNLGWHFATLLLGGAATLWAAWQALTTAANQSSGFYLVQMQVGLALAGIGLGTSAGLAAGCFALLVAPLLALGLSVGNAEQVQPGIGYADAQAEHGAPAPVIQEDQARRMYTAQRNPPRVRWALWLLSGALPLTAPFVSAWMGIGAAAAGGVLLLSGALWLAALMAALAVARLAGGDTVSATDRRLLLAAGGSVVLGVASPSVAQFLIRPVVRQLQGGLTPFGDIALWPWGGLVALDSARQQVAAWPSMTIVALMLVLGALTWLLARLGATLRDTSRG